MALPEDAHQPPPAASLHHTTTKKHIKAGSRESSSLQPLRVAALNLRSSTSHRYRPSLLLSLSVTPRPRARRCNGELSQASFPTCKPRNPSLQSACATPKLPQLLFCLALRLLPWVSETVTSTILNSSHTPSSRRQQCSSSHMLDSGCNPTFSSSHALYLMLSSSATEKSEGYLYLLGRCLDFPANVSRPAKRHRGDARFFGARLRHCIFLLVFSLQ